MPKKKIVEEQLIRNFLANLPSFLEGEWVGFEQVAIGEDLKAMRYKKIDLLLIESGQGTGDLQMMQKLRSNYGLKLSKVSSQISLLTQKLPGKNVWIIEAETSIEKLWEALGSFGTGSRILAAVL